ncbi:sarcosine oxidase subunit alpha family protein [Coralliovum pocilloporae]|uniref:sarcosine oxidase subunit alpha family protein n=1 Tax=Coralliovum pocilloporae TaxID=3066369 RepID=UPI0033072F9D
MAGFRLSSGGRNLDRSKSLRFSFDGRAHTGLTGDTLASALLASGQTLFGRSFKYHRPRGVLSAGPEEPNALVTLRSGARAEVNTKAPVIELFDGLEARSQNAWPSLETDFMAVNSLFSPFFSAGFYYKTFIGPFKKGTKAWMFFEHFIRNAAGLGNASREADPDRYERGNLFCDVLVVGSGPAGLMAARSAAASGARIILAEDSATLGGALPEESQTIDGLPAADWASRELDRLAELESVRIMPRTAVFGYYDDNTLGAVERVADHVAVPGEGVPRQKYWTIRTAQVVIASGALERPLVFAGNDTPGVMLADAMQRYAARYGVSAGRSVAIFTCHDGGWATAQALVEAGVPVTAIIDPRKEMPAAYAEALQGKGITFYPGHVVAEASGGKALKTIHVAPYDAMGERLTGPAKAVSVDALGVSGGWTPSVHLVSQAGDKPVFREDISAFVPAETAGKGWRSAGSVNGAFSLKACLEEGQAAGQAAAVDAGFPISEDSTPVVEGAEASMVPLPLYEVPSPNGKGKKFVDFQHDVKASDVRLANQEGFRSVEHLKRYTTLGMAADQGKTSNVNGLAIMAAARDAKIDDVGTTRFRPPYTPVALGPLAGREVGDEVLPERRTAAQDWHEARGARMVSVGLWRRPQAYIRPGENLEAAATREARAVRERVGMVDVSTLGKIDVQGPDAAEFLNRVYSNAFAKLPVGKARYGLMFRDDGLVYDDGTTWRLSENQFLMTTTTAAAATVMQELEFLLATAWPDLKVQLTSVTDHWSGQAVAGPKSRELLSSVITDVDFSNEAFPFMAIRTGSLNGAPVTIARLSFSGELAYEVFTPAHFGLSVWEQLMEAGQSFGIEPYGTEALNVLRVEKGHVTHAEIDGRTTADDMGLGGLASKKKPFVGSVLHQRPALQAEGRHQLVGLMSKDGQELLAGSHLVANSALQQPAQSLGHVTSPCYSVVKEQYIALAFLENGRARHGETLYATYPLKDRHQPVEIVDPCFYDPEGSRMHV